MERFRFVLWILLFSILLSVIPLLFLSGFASLGKIFGIILIVSLSVALWIWRKQTIKYIAYEQRVRMNTNDRFWLKTHVPFYRNLNSKDKSVFEDRLGLLLANVDMINQNGNIPERSEAISLSALATIFLWDLPLFVFENSRWVIGLNDINQETEHGLCFSLSEINDKLKDNIMLIELDASFIKGYELGCIENFLFELKERYNNTRQFSPYEKDFWIFLSKILSSSENVKKYFLN